MKLPADFAGWADEPQGVLNLDAPQPPARPTDLGAVDAPVPPPRPADLGMGPVAVQNPPEPPARPPEFGPSAKLPPDFAGWADEAPGIGEVAVRALGKGMVHGYETGKQGTQVLTEGGFTGLKPQEAGAPDAVDEILRKPLADGWKDPNWWTAQILHGLGGSWPALGAGVAGGAAGGALGGPLGALGGSAGGFGAGSALQALAPSYLKAREEGLEHDKAVDRALIETGIAGAVGTAMGAAPAFRPFKQAIADSMLMLFGTAPALMSGQRAAENVVEGKPIGEGVPEAAALGIGTGALLGGAHAVARGVAPKRAGVEEGPAPGSVDDFLRQANEAEARSRGARTKAEIDEFIRQKEAQDAVREGAARQLPAPDGAGPVAETRSPVGESAPVDQGPVQGRSEDRNDVRQPGPPGGAPDVPNDRPNAGPGAVPTGEPVSPAVEPTRAAEDAALRNAGWIDEDIASMSAKQRKSELEAAGYVPPKVEEAPAENAGSRARPVKVETPDDLAPARDRVNQEPSEAQIAAGNYAKGHAVYDGLPVSIENPKGSTRRGVSPDGSPWEVAMPGDYGYIKNSKGADKDHVDILIGDKPPNGKVFVVDQHDPATSKFDELKVIAGVDSVGEAARLYHRSFSDGSGVSRVGAITELPTEQLRQMLADGHGKKPFADIFDARKRNARPLSDAGAHDLVADQTAVSQSQEQAVPDVRGQGNNDRAGVEGRLPGVPAGRGKSPAQGPDAGSDRQQQGVRAGEHALDRLDNSVDQSTRTPLGNSERGEGDGRRSEPASRVQEESGEREASPRNVGREGVDAGEIGARSSEAAKPNGAIPVDWHAEGRKAYDSARQRMLPDGLKGEDARAWERGNWAAQREAQRKYVEAARKRAENRMPTTLVQFLRGMGGVHDEGGDLKSQDMHKRFIGLVSSRGVSLDQAREAAAEAGYLGHDKERAVSETTVSDLLDALMDHPRYSTDDEQQVYDVKEKLAAKKHERAIASRKAEIQTFMEEHSLSPDAEAVERAAVLMQDERLPMEEAFERAVMQLAHETPETRAALDETTEDGFDAIPWDEWTGPVAAYEEGQEAAARPTGGGDKAPGGEGQKADERGETRPADDRPAQPESARADQAPEKGRDVGNEGEPGGRKGAVAPTEPAAEPTVEPGAEGKPQTVIPGAEQAAPATMAGLKAAAPLKPTVPQKGAGGMFDEAETAPQLFDAKPEPAKEPEPIQGMLTKGELPHVDAEAKGGYLPPPWQDIGGGFKAREYVRDRKNGKSEIRQEVMEPQSGILGRDLGMDGREIGFDIEGFGDPFDPRNPGKPGAVESRIRDYLKNRPKQLAAAPVPGVDMPGRPAAPVAPSADLIAKHFGPDADAVRDAIQPYLDNEGTAADAKRNLSDALDDLLSLEKPDVRKARRERAMRAFAALVDEATRKAPEPVAAAPKAPETKAENPVPPDHGPVEALRHKFGDPSFEGFPSIVHARKFMLENGFKPVEGLPENKQIEEAIEHAIVLAARDIAAIGTRKGNPSEAFDRLVRLYEKQPRLGSRTSTSVSEQAYSTPAPLAYVASQLAGIDKNKIVVEPTAGNAMLLIEADPKKARVNELNATRADALEAQGFNPSRADATLESTFADFKGKADVVIANPPFGAVREGGESKTFRVPGLNTTAIDYAIALNALEAMKPDGRAVLILGGVKAESLAERQKGYMSPGKRKFFHVLLNKYNVADIFTVSGGLYERQGAGWPVDVVVIDGKGKSDRKPLTAEPPPLLKTWGEIKEKLNGAPERGVLGDGGETPRAPDAAGGKPARDDAGSGEPAIRGELAEPQPAVGERAPVGAKPDRGQSAPAGRGELGDEPRPAAEPLRERPRTDYKPDPERRRSVEANSAGQVSYRPAATSGRALGSLLPANLRTATEKSLDRVQREHGQIDHYVADALGYSLDNRGMYFTDGAGNRREPFSAEQVDAIGLALHNIAKGDGFIIGDSTGVGKGRVVAAAIRYAHRTGKTPVFVTEKPDLFGDMWRDMHDIGWPQALGRPINMFMTNAGTRIPLDEKAVEWVAEREAARDAGEPIPPRQGQFSESQSPDGAAKRMDAIVSGDETPDVVFTTYDQMNSVRGMETERRSFLRRIAPRAFLIMDEAHNAGGQGNDTWDAKDKAPPRSVVFREAVQAADSVLYSSATYAKSPKVMDLFSRTDMAKAVENPSDLAELIERGGIPLQQVVSAMLADAGQYMRRERSFEGVTYEPEIVPVDEASYETFTEALGTIFRFDRSFAKERAQLADKIAKELGAGVGKDGGTGEGGASSVTFSAIMHNAISQMVLSIKAKGAAARAIQAIEAGEKPVIALSATMESFLGDMAEALGLKPGDPINADFGDVLRRYMERTRRVTIKMPDDTKKHVMIPLSDMSPGARADFEDASKFLKSVEMPGLPLSPIDAIRSELQKSGYSVREITGRSLMIDYTGDEPVLAKRPEAERGSTGKRLTIKAFNDGKLDAVILNRSGSTGVSMHASEFFKDRRKRRMILVQADPNIDTHMQMLGRIHRTGQVELPAYTQLAADIPAEVRPTAVLMGKMASLNANTTASRKSNFTGEAVDFMNRYGDLVASAALHDMPELSRILDVTLTNDNGEVTPGLIAKVTGRLTLLKPKDQQALIDRISEDYKALLARLDAEGTNDLEAKSVDLQAKVLESQTIKAATGSSPFTGAVMLDKVSVKSQGRAMAPAEVIEALADRLEQPVTPNADFRDELRRLAAVGAQGQAALMSRVTEAAQAFAKKQIGALKKPDAIDKARTEANTALARWQDIAGNVAPGRTIGINFADEDMPAVVLGFRYKGKEGGNPIAPSQWSLDLALPNSMRSLTIPASQIFTRSYPQPPNAKKGGLTLTDQMHDASMLESMFENARKEGRETRFIFSGNILAAFDQTGGAGQILNYTMEDGSSQPGILMNRKFDPADFMAGRAIRFKTGAQALAFLDQFPKGEIASKGEVVTVRRARGGFYEFDMPAAKATGGRFFTDAKVRQVYDNWEKRGSRMRATVAAPTARALVDAMMDLGAAFETRENQAAAQEIVNADAKAPQMAQAARVASPPDGSWARLGRIRADVERIVRSVLPPDAVRVDVVDGLVPVEDAAMLEKSGSKDVSLGATGMYQAGVDKLIQVGTASNDTKNTAYHEAWHAAQDLGLASPREIELLRSPAERERLRRFANSKGLNGSAMTQVELEANFFGAYAAAMDRGEAPPRLHASSMGVFGRLYDLIRRIRNYLRGLGAEITEDIAARFQRGEMRDRPFWDRGESRLYGKDVEEPARFAQAAPPEERYFGERPLKEKIEHKIASLPDRTDRIESILDMHVRVDETAKALADGRRIAPDIDPYKAKRLLPGRTAATQANFKRDHLEPLVHAAKQAGLTLQDIAEWLYAKHAPERNAAMDEVDPRNEGRGSGITDDQAGKIIDRLTRDGKAGSLENIARRVAAIREFNLDLAESAGLLSEEQATAYRTQYADYVPLKGWDDPSLEPENAREQRPGGGLRVAGKEFKMAFGRKTIPSDPLSNLVNDTYRMIDRAEKNRALNTVWRFMRSIPADEREGVVTLDKGKMVKTLDKQTGMVVWREEAAWRFRDNVVPLKIGGQPHYLVFEDPQIAQALMRTSATHLHWLVGWMGRVINTAKSAWTHWNPDFVARHFFLRYPIEGASNAGENGLGAAIRSFKGYPGGPAYKAIRRHAALDQAGRDAAIARLSDPNATPEDRWMGYYEEMRRAGGLMNWADFGGVDRVRKKLDSALASLDKNPVRASAAYARGVHEAVNIITSAMDNAQRLAAYVEAREKGASRVDAGMAAREATVDFALKGTLGNYLTLMWPFANTAAQTASRMTRATRRSKAAMAGVLGSWVALGLTAGLFAYLFGGDDKDGKPFIEKIGDWTRRLNLVVPFGPKDDKGRPYMITISLPYNYALPFTIGQTMAVLIMKAMGRSKEKPSHIFGNLTHSALEAFTPIAQENSMIGKFMPELYRPFHHVAANKNWFGGPVHPNEEPWNRGLPKAERSFRNTADGWKMLARGMHNYTGFDAHPEDYREIMSYFTSTMQGVFTRAATAAGDAARGDKPDPTDVPIIHALIGGGKQYDSADRRAYFEARDQKYTAETRAKDLRKSAATEPGGIDKAREYQEKNAKDIVGAKSFHSADAMRRSIMKQMDRVRADTGISADEKNRRMKVLQDRELEIMRRARAMSGE